VNTPSMEQELRRHGFRNLARWGRGVDTVRFRPRKDGNGRLDGPIFLYAGRVAVEKNIEAFLRLDLPGRKILVGDGPDLPLLRERHPEACFTGRLDSAALAEHMAAADVFVFPSRTDTFGLVMLEAMASGVPVAAYPVAGPIDVVRHGETGWLAEDLRIAALRALEMDRNACRRHAEHFSWRRSTEEFLACLHPLNRQIAA
jgi:glycosyltransferase involved in cell wall biosynthesis